MIRPAQSVANPNPKPPGILSSPTIQLAIALGAALTAGWLTRDPLTAVHTGGSVLAVFDSARWAIHCRRRDDD